MVVPFVLLIASLVGLVAGLTVPGLSDVVLLALPCAVASLILLIRALVTSGTRDAGRATHDLRLPRQVRPAPAIRDAGHAAHGFRLPRHVRGRVILIDGSNVLHWKDNTAQIDTLRAVVVHLIALGYAPSVVFDANAGYLVAGKYQHDKALGDLLALPEDQVMVVAKGQSADPVLLAAARAMGARIVTNDLYRDWAGAHPEVREPGLLVRGGWRDGALWLDLDEMAVA